MLNNRQPGRRRGRTGQRPPGNGGRNQEQGNRIDNRARGNAPQMLEKYKALARDAQMQGDRVITEYYLQFAEHYFRVVAEMRSRQDEVRRPRDDWQGDDNYSETGEDDEPMAAETPDSEDDQAAAERAHESQRRQPRQHDNRQPRRDGQEHNSAKSDNPSERHNQARRVFAETRGEIEPAMIDAAVLPPAFGGEVRAALAVDRGTGGEADVAQDAPPKRRGRPRKAPTDDVVA